MRIDPDYKVGTAAQLNKTRTVMYATGLVVTGLVLILAGVLVQPGSICILEKIVRIVVSVQAHLRHQYLTPRDRNVMEQSPKPIICHVQRAHRAIA